MVDRKTSRLAAIVAALILSACEQRLGLLTDGYGQTVTAGGGLTESERVAIAIFRNASPSVVQVVTQLHLSRH
jgi:hypothetical protein